jgi:hypothetical protein
MDRYLFGYRAQAASHRYVGHGGFAGGDLPHRRLDPRNHSRNGDSFPGPGRTDRLGRRNRVPNRGPNFDEPRNPAYQAARAELESSFKERLAILDPKTRAKVEASLAVIQQAHEDMRRALEAQPSNPVLEGLLESTWQDEFDLYDDVVRNTQPAMLRS